MIQKARSASSQSLLREAETAIFLIKDENMKRWFEEEARKVIEKRRDPDAYMTGATDLKRVLLAYLSQQGEVKTANIWCRSILSYKVSEFLEELEQILQEHNIEGVVELHWQDRELNSPHIQFVGTNAEFAEKIIAEAIVERGFEKNISEALTLPDIPAYYSQDKSDIRVVRTDDIVRDEEEFKQAEIEYKARQSHIKEFVNVIKNAFNPTNFKLKFEKLHDEIEQLRASLYNEIFVSEFNPRRNKAKVIISDVLNKDITNIVTDTNNKKFSNKQGDKR